MIQLPVGFDVDLLVSDMIYIVVPFAGIAVLFAISRIIRRCASAL